MLCGQVFLPPTPSNAIISFYLLVATVGVLTSPVLAGVAVVVALVHVEVAVGSLEAGLAGAAVVVAQRGALASVPAGVVSTVVLLLAELASPAQGTGAGEGGHLVLELVHHAPTSVLTDLLSELEREQSLHIPRAAGVQVLAVFSNIFLGASRKQEDTLSFPY